MTLRPIYHPPLQNTTQAAAFEPYTTPDTYNPPRTILTPAPATQSYAVPPVAPSAASQSADSPYTPANAALNIRFAVFYLSREHFPTVDTNGSEASIPSPQSLSIKRLHILCDLFESRAALRTVAVWTRYAETTFSALPDGAHLSAEDYSYSSTSTWSRNPTTIFGISCNRQIAASALLVKMPDATRSTVQNAVVVLASKPIFGPIRDKLEVGVVDDCLVQSEGVLRNRILDDFGSSLEQSPRGQLTESRLYMGTNLCELVHTFRPLQSAQAAKKRIMSNGHSVERFCLYQYSFVSLLPGLLQTLNDCGSPPLGAPALSRPTSLRISDRKSMAACARLPLDIFGNDAFLQPYLPLQQLDVAADAKSWLYGSTNSIVTQRKEVDLLVNLEGSAGLTPADCKWMDDSVKNVNDGWNGEEGRPVSMMFEGI
ncbi:transport protein Avl9-domain-containing protein [Mycena olivaceomarginata]|nr:transport protein Avl9-domain-containing protein [Mycena olivaceomarginata]